jgi:hypothetical protein
LFYWHSSFIYLPRFLSADCTTPAAPPPSANLMGSMYRAPLSTAWSSGAITWTQVHPDVSTLKRVLARSGAVVLCELCFRSCRTHNNIWVQNRTHLITARVLVHARLSWDPIRLFVAVSWAISLIELNHLNHPLVESSRHTALYGKLSY